MNKYSKNKKAIIIISISIIISSLLANTADFNYNEIGLGVFIVWFYPFLVGAGTIVLYYGIMWLSKKLYVIIIIISFLINIYFGLYLQFYLA